MSAHHGPPCGHTVLGTCTGCGNGIRMVQGTFYIPPDPVKPLDVVVDGVKLRKLLELDWRNRREKGETHNMLSPTQRAAVSAYWSARLRAKIAVSAAAEKTRQPSVVVDLED